MNGTTNGSRINNSPMTLNGTMRVLIKFDQIRMISTRIRNQARFRLQRRARNNRTANDIRRKNGNSAVGRPNLQVASGLQAMKRNSNRTILTNTIRVRTRSLTVARNQRGTRHTLGGKIVQRSL